MRAWRRRTPKCPRRRGDEALIHIEQMCYSGSLGGRGFASDPYGATLPAVWRHFQGRRGTDLLLTHVREPRTEAIARADVSPVRNRVRIAASALLFAAMRRRFATDSLGSPMSEMRDVVRPASPEAEVLHTDLCWERRTDIATHLWWVRTDIRPAVVEATVLHEDVRGKGPTDAYDATVSRVRSSVPAARDCTAFLHERLREPRQDEVLGRQESELEGRARQGQHRLCADVCARTPEGETEEAVHTRAHLGDGVDTRPSPCHEREGASQERPT